MVAMAQAKIPDEKDLPLARESSRRLARYASKSLTVRVGGKPVTLPASAVRLLVEILTQMSQGNAVTIVPFHAELTTQQAANFLSVSRPFVVKLLESGAIPFVRIGTHRRVRFKDLAKYKQKSRAQSRKLLDRLAAEAQELELGY